VSAFTETRDPYPGARGPTRAAASVHGHAVSIRVEPFNWGIRIEYLGAPRVLLAAGCLTEGMAIRRSQGRKNIDARGHNYAMHRSPTKALPDRLRIKLYIDRENEDAAMELPGVHELFPDGLPTIEEAPKEQAERDGTPRSIQEWHEQVGDFCGSMLHSALVALKGGPTGPDAAIWVYGSRFRVVEADVQAIERLQAELLSAINRARIVDLKRAGLRLVVNNEGRP
jgi:hypothetical protein